MTTHDDLAFAVAEEAVRRIRTGDSDWSHALSTSVYATRSRGWPILDFVLADTERETHTAAEFKPPGQSKREYLTGLGQAVAYTRDFAMSLLVIPSLADDGYQIADHIREILDQDVADSLPIGLLEYDARTIASTRGEFTVTRKLPADVRSDLPAAVEVADSFWAKWRDVSQNELGRLLRYLYNESDDDSVEGTIRDRAFDRLWSDMQMGRTTHWGGGQRHVADTPRNKTAWGKNYRNFVAHIGWSLPDGRLTAQGLHALTIEHQYDSAAGPFVDLLARALLLHGKHLVLINLINRFQDARESEIGRFESEQTWLNELEEYLESEGFLQRNPGRHTAAVRRAPRAFLKAEKTIWRNLKLFVPYGSTGGRSFHPGRGFIFDWARITSLIGDASEE